MAIKKDEGWYCWLVAGAIMTSMTLTSMSTYGTISVLVNIWTNKFNIPAEVVAWAPAIMNVSMLLIGNLRVVCITNKGAQSLYGIFALHFVRSSVALVTASGQPIRWNKFF